MACIPEIESRLQRWAQGVTVGDGSGFPAMSVIHPSWQPPTPGTSPTMKVAPASDVRQTHAAIAKLSDRLRATVMVHYVLKWPIADQARVLECGQATVYARVERAHVELLGILGRRGSFCNKEEM